MTNANIATDNGLETVTESDPLPPPSEKVEFPQPDSPPPSERQDFGFRSVVNPTAKPDEIFNPSIHAVDADGNPRKKLDGTFAKKRGRQAGYSANAGNPETSAEDLMLWIEAKKHTQIVVGTGMAIFGLEWEATEGERIVMETAFHNYFESVGIVRMPPWIELGTAIGLGYVAPRIHLESTQQKMKQIVGAIRSRKVKSNVQTSNRYANVDRKQQGKSSSD